MHDTIFREYDIRGRVNGELSLAQVYDLACAIAYYYLDKDKNVHTLAIGMDGRIHSEAIKKELCRALIDSGISIIDIGMCPSPVLYFALHMLPVQGGIMITASHNPKEYNGMKLCLGTRSIWGSELRVIRDLYRKKSTVKTNKQGIVKVQKLVPAYCNWLADHFKHLKGFDIKAVIDCGNGAGGIVLPTLCEQLKLSQVQLLCAEVDGTYPNHEADPVVEKNMQEVKKALTTTDIQVGIGLDGDCDRMSVMTKAGELLTGDKILALFAYDIVRNNPGAVVLFDVKSSQSLIDLLHQLGAQPHMVPCGHAIIKEYIPKYNALLAGELSCHFFFKDRYFGYDDGIYALLRLFEVLMQSGKSLSELLKIFPHKISSPEYRINYDEKQRRELIDTVKNIFASNPDAQLTTIDGVRVVLPYGWGIVRASNTQPKLSLRFESDTHEGLHRIKNDFIEILSRFIAKDYLNNMIC